MQQRSKAKWNAGEQDQGHPRRKNALPAHAIVERPRGRRR
jgi:hypothetical protein